MTGAGDPFIGMRLADRYELEERIGDGGMGVVYRARQLGLDREVAVKLLASGRSSDPGWLARFRAEAQALARLQHPNTVRVYEFGTFNDVPFLVMELLGGRTLEQELKRREVLPATRALKILIQLCNSLEESHRAGIVHGDVKPQNVFLLDVVGATDFVKLVDFSVARLAWSEPTDDRYMGTPAYMSPESTAGGTVGPATDVYACGVVAFRMLTGHLPLPSRAETLRALFEETPDNVAAIVLRAMETSPDERYPGVADLRRDCEQSLAIVGVPYPLTLPVAPPRAAARRRYSCANPPPGLGPRLRVSMSSPSALAWSPDGRWLAVAQYGHLHLIDLETGGRTSEVPCGSIYALSWRACREQRALRH